MNVMQILNYLYSIYNTYFKKINFFKLKNKIIEFINFYKRNKKNYIFTLIVLAIFVYSLIKTIGF